MTAKAANIIIIVCSTITIIFTVLTWLGVKHKKGEYHGINGSEKESK